MRHYNIKMMNGFSKFKCLCCAYSVTTREFSSLNGSCRTQAAKVMNEHASHAHHAMIYTSGASACLDHHSH
jgi:hypothetical protein